MLLLQEASWRLLKYIKTAPKFICVTKKTSITRMNRFILQIRMDRFTLTSKTTEVVIIYGGIGFFRFTTMNCGVVSILTWDKSHQFLPYVRSPVLLNYLALCSS